MRRKLIFVGGIHGVGKTELCRRLSVSIAALHLSASELIHTTGDDQAGKGVRDMLKNQYTLLRALDEPTYRDRSLLLDGHFCLLTEDGLIQAVPTQVFEQLDPSVLVVLTNAPSTIKQRLRQRDGANYEVAFLNNFQEQEISRARIVSAATRAPLIVGDLSLGEAEAIQHIRSSVENAGWN